jgi:CDP-2,3-bis-(O-geranylgeranyl)-sn-glycerol synthase
MAVVEMLLLLIAANGAPVIACNVFGNFWDRPLDGGARLADGQRIFGPSKTVRGVLASIGLSVGVAMLLGLGPAVGLWAGALAMLGDLVSSFCKRRLRLPPSSRARGLDQIPESLFPALAGHWYLRLSWLDVGLVVALFFLLEVGFSPLLFKLKIRDRPY